MTEPTQPVTPPASPPAPAAPVTLPTAPPPTTPELTIEPPAPPTPPPPLGPNAVTYEPTGDAGLDVALDFIGGLGFGPEHPAVKAAGNGDFDQLRVILAGLGDKAKGHERFVKLAEDSVKRQRDAAEAKTAAATKAVVAEAGGDGAWEKLKVWVRENAEPDELASVNAALKAGGLAATAVVRELKALYAKSGTATQAPANALGSATGGTTASDALDPTAYTKAIADLTRRGQINSPEAAALRARRQAWKG